MESTISIENENMANYTMFRLDKLDNEFTEEELNQITEMVIDYDDEKNSSFNFLEELLKYKSLRSIILRNGYIYNDNFNIFLKLNNLIEIIFDNCHFENADFISSLKIKSLSLINCNIESYSFVSSLKELEELTIINGTIEIAKINCLNNLKFLQISYSKIIGDFNLDTIGLTELYIDNTNIINFNFLSSLYNLKVLSIDSKQYSVNKMMLNDLIKKGISVLNENIGEFGGGDDEI